MRAGLGRQLWPWAIACAVVTAGSVVLAVTFWRGGPNGIAASAAVLALVPLGVAVLAWAWNRSKLALPATRNQLADAKRDLAAKVREQWLEESRARRLYDPDPVVVTWRPTKRAVRDLPVSPPGAAQRFVTRADEVAELARWFSDLERHRLVIIGDPGMGKTTLAVLLLLELLDPATCNQQRPVPVLFSLASFDPEGDGIDAWLARRLGQEHPWLRAAPYGADLPRALVRQREILPVLDGLDEIPAGARPGVIVALNRAMADGELGLILTCRGEEYAAAVAAGDVLRTAAVIEPDPLSPRQAAAYLKSCIPPAQRAVWKPVLGRLGRRPATPLALALATPLMLWLVRHVYLDTGRDPSGLADSSVFPTAETVQAHLMDDLIPALISANPPNQAQLGRPRRNWDPGKAQRWLRYLACHLRRQRTPDLAWWQLWKAIPPAGFGLGAAFAVGLGAALGAGVPAGPTVEPLTAGLVVELAAGLTGGLGVGLVFARWCGLGQLGRLHEKDGPGRLFHVFVSVPGAVLISAAGAGVTVGLAFGLSSWISSGPAAGIAGLPQRWRPSSRPGLASASPQRGGACRSHRTA